MKLIKVSLCSSIIDDPRKINPITVGYEKLEGYDLLNVELIRCLTHVKATDNFHVYRLDMPGAFRDGTLIAIENVDDFIREINSLRG